MKSITIKLLKKVVDNARDNEKNVAALKLETSRVLGPMIDTECKLTTLAENINDRVSVLQRTGRTTHVGFKPSVVIPFLSHQNDEVRAMAMNLVPQKFVSQYKTDPSSKVRTIVANRSNISVVKEMMRLFPQDDELRAIYRHKSSASSIKTLTEASDERLEDLIEDVADDDLTDVWYENTAARLIDTYGKNTVSDVWVTSAVNNMVKHSLATSGVEIDAEMLLDAVYEQLAQKEKSVSLKEMAQRLLDESEDEI